MKQVHLRLDGLGDLAGEFHGLVQGLESPRPCTAGHDAIPGTMTDNQQYGEVRLALMIL